MDVNNHMVDALLDTGSDCSLIKESAAKFINVNIHSAKSVPPLQGVAGQKLRVLGQIHTEIRMGDKIMRAKMVVVPDHYRLNLDLTATSGIWSCH